MFFRKTIGLALLMLLLLPGAAPLAAQGEVVPAAYQIDPNQFSHVYQMWNNCGPATLTMNLSYYGMSVPDREAQRSAASYLKPNTEDQNVSPWQMVDYVNSQGGIPLGLRAITRAGGDFELLKRLLSNNFPVIIEEGYEPHDASGNYLEWMGHYLLLTGYDDNSQEFVTHDSYAGPNLRRAYSEVARLWGHFNNQFIILYPQEREAELQSLMGEMWDERFAWEQAKTRAQTNASANQQDHWAWFNLGEAFSYLGEHQSAAVAYQQAFNLRALPFRTLWYMHGAFETFYQLGEYETVKELARQVQDVTPYIEEANYYRGLVYAAEGRPEDAIYRFDQVLMFNPNFYPAQVAKEAVQNGTYQPPATEG